MTGAAAAEDPMAGGATAGNTPHSGLFGDLLDRFTEIVGPAASEATFHYASLQEGMRLAQGHGPRDLAQALARVDAVVGQRSRILEDRDRIRVAVSGSALLSSGNPVRQAVVRGLIEGVLRVVRGRPYTGRITPEASGEFILEFTSEAGRAPSS